MILQTSPPDLIVYNDDGSVLHSATSSNSELIPHNGYLTLDVSAATTTGLTLTGLSRRGNVSEPGPCGELPFSGSGLLANYILRVTSPGFRDQDPAEGFRLFRRRVTTWVICR